MSCHDIENFTVRGNDISLCRKDLVTGPDSVHNILHLISGGVGGVAVVCLNICFFAEAVIMEVQLWCKG